MRRSSSRPASRPAARQAGREDRGQGEQGHTDPCELGHLQDDTGDQDEDAERGANIHRWYDGGAELQRGKGSRVLNGVSRLVGSDTHGRDARRAIDALGQEERAIARIVMIRQLALGRLHRHVIEPIGVEHAASHLSAGHVDRVAHLAELGVAPAHLALRPEHQ